MIFAALASSLFAIGAMAQSRPDIIVSVGYQGANVSNFESSKMVSGVRAGVALDFGVANMGTMQFSVQPGLNFSMKGWSAGSENLNVNKTTNLYYIDLPILANLRFDAGRDLNAFVNAGPYLAYGVGGKTSGNFLSIEYSKDVNPFKKYDGESLYRAFDWGLQVGAGVEYRRIMLGVGTQVGLYDITPGESLSNKNTSFFVSLGYRF